MLRMPALTSLNAFTPSTPWAVTTPRYSVTGRPSIPGVVVMSISVPPYLRLSLTRDRARGLPRPRFPPGACPAYPAPFILAISPSRRHRPGRYAVTQWRDCSLLVHFPRLSLAQRPD